MTSILIFVTQPELYKLIGLAPLSLAVVTILLTGKVYNMFLEMGLSPPTMDFPAGPYLVSGDMKSLQSGSEFYPGDPVRREREVRGRMERHQYRSKDDDSDLSIVSKVRSSQMGNFEIYSSAEKWRVLPFL